MMGGEEVTMARRSYARRLLEHLFSLIPSGPDDRPKPTTIPDPNEPGISAKARQVRLRLLLQRYQKNSRGSGR